MQVMQAPKCAIKHSECIRRDSESESQTVTGKLAVNRNRKGVSSWQDLHTENIFKSLPGGNRTEAA